MIVILFTLIASLLIVQSTRTYISIASFVSGYRTKDTLKRHFLKQRFIDNVVLLLVLFLFLITLYSII